MLFSVPNIDGNNFQNCIGISQIYSDFDESDAMMRAMQNSSFLVETCRLQHVLCWNIASFSCDFEKEKTQKAQKLYSQAFSKLEKAHKSDKKNPDILNYMGFTSRKVGNFDQAEKFYLKGLNIKPNHNGINEYLGELYVQTNRIDKANERLEVLKSCNCKEYGELELIIKTRGSKVY